MALFAPATLPAALPPPQTLDLGDTEINLHTPPPTPTIDPLTGVQTAEQGDGSVVIDFSPKKEKQSGHSANLADDMSYMDMGGLADDLLRGIESDLESRRELEMLFQRGIDLLGTRFEEASGDVTAQGSVSKVWHPLLLEAVISYQANAQAELLPSAGPVKVRDDEPETQDAARMELAEAFEKDFNHYLTTVRKEYYPDTRRMLTAQGFMGTAFKKVYRCPLRRAPVSDFVSAMDLIVSNDAVSLANAGRITHQSLMRPSVMKRMQILGAYIDTALPQPNAQMTEAERKVKQNEGIESQFRQEDNPYRIYECYADMDMAEYGVTEKGAPDGLPLPYRVTLDKDSRKILEIRRNWKEDDKDFKALIHFVKYGFVPSLGFYDWGLVHILGNTARALTAIERQLLDAGQFANFPGLLFSDRGQRQETTQIRVPPGGGHSIKTGGVPLNQMVMPLPYKEPSAVLAELANKIAEDGRQLGMTALVNVGEGRADVPVGTMVAMIEQSTKVMAAVHKQNHAAQQEEFEKLKDLFAEDPETLWKFAKSPARKWQQAAEFADVELVPASDPNVPSKIHRIMMAQALVQLVQAFPEIKRQWALDIILTTLGYASGPQNISPPAPPGQQADPKAAAAMANTQVTAKLKAAELEQKNTQQQREAAAEVVHAQVKDKELTMDQQMQREDIASRERIAATEQETERLRLAAEQQRADREHVADAVNDDREHGLRKKELENQVKVGKSKADKPVAKS